jgi:hypothetical protein
MKKIFLILFLFVLHSSLFSQKKLFLKDSFELDGYKFKKISSKNINEFCSFNNKTILIHYSNWCSAFINVDSIYRHFNDHQVYMIFTHKNVSIQKQVDFLKEKNIKCTVLYTDFDLYKRSSWSDIFDEFLHDICKDCVSRGYDITKNVILIDEKCNVSFPFYKLI